MKRLLETRADGSEVWFETFEDGKHRLFTIANVDPVLDLNSKMRNDSGYSKRGIKRGMWHYASIPNDVLAMWHGKGIIDMRYPLSPSNESGALYKSKRARLQREKKWAELKEMDKRQEMADRNKKAITRMLNTDYAYLKTVSGRV